MSEPETGGAAGGAGRAEDFVPELYAELRAAAARLLARGRGAGDVIQPTDLVHELYLRLQGRPDRPWTDRAHFLAISVRAMRQVMVEQARLGGAQKRGEGWRRVTLSGLGRDAGLDAADLLDLEEALERLMGLDERQGRIVELRAWAGLTIDETARVLDLSPATVEREWRAARAWIVARLERPKRSP